CLESPTGKGAYVWSVDREEMVEGVSHYVIKQGMREIFYRTADLAHTRETVDGALVRQHSPSRTRYAWPLAVGTTWEQAFREDRPVERRVIEREDVVSVEGEETLTVLAGTFRTLKIAYRNKRTTAIRYEEWYAPELKTAVRIRDRLDSGLQVRQLVAYSLQCSSSPRTESGSRSWAGARSRPGDGARGEPADEVALEAVVEDDRRDRVHGRDGHQEVPRRVVGRQEVRHRHGQGHARLAREEEQGVEVLVPGVEKRVGSDGDQRRPDQRQVEVQERRDRPRAI